MRYMMMVKASAASEAGVLPTPEQMAEMGAYNEQLLKAGVMRDGAGLKATSQGAKVQFRGGKRTLIDGPFTETKEIVSGYWIIEVGSHQEAVDWMMKAPNPAFNDTEGEIELRPFFEEADFA